MAFADPQSILVNAVPIELPRVSTGTNSSIYQKDDATYKLTASHSVSKGRARRMVRLDHLKVASDPLLAGVNVNATMAVYLVVDAPTNGTIPLTDQFNVIDALTQYLRADSGERATQLLGGEN